tara:strand:+ start:405 stop:698 length:294 start_codon:yes stop_codon:yes gene_type:complete
MNKDETMKRAGFTPGPWKVGNYNYIRGTIFSVAVAIDLPGRDEKEKQANARLIASAPELYEQCKFLERMLAHTDHHSSPKLAQLRELLAKVDGGDEG